MSLLDTLFASKASMYPHPRRCVPAPKSFRVTLHVSEGYHTPPLKERPQKEPLQNLSGVGGRKASVFFNFQAFHLVKDSRHG